MAMFLLLFLVVNVFSQDVTGPTSHGKKVVCYMHNWSNYRKDLGQFSIEDIDPQLCTDVIYSFAALDEAKNTIRSGDLWQDLETDYGRAGYRRVVALKEQNPRLKVSISLGGWAEGSVKYSNMAATPATRAVFVASVLEFLKEYNFDGLDMHWKFPTLRDGKPADKANYVLLLKELKEAFTPHNYQLTAAFGAGKSTMEAAYDLAKLNRHLDFMHLLSFDYHGAWDGSVGSNAPLTGGPNDFNNLEFSINYMLKNGVSAHKIVLGLPFFGRTFELKDPGVGSIQFGRTQTKPVGFQGPYTVENGQMGYFEICMETSNKSSHWSHHWEEKSATAYIRDKERVICYDSGRTISIKVKVAVDRGLGGLMVWSLDSDDFKGLCEPEVEPYRDFSERFEQLTANSGVARVIRSLNLPDAQSAKPTDYYITSNGQLSLRLPARSSDANYNLLRIVNGAASLATQEKRIVDALGGVVASVASPGNAVQDTGTPGFRSDYKLNSRVGYWFKVHSVAANWHTARLICHYEGGELASPRNAAVTAAIKEAIATVQPKSSLYYSGVHQTFGNGVYVTVEGIPLEKLDTTNWDVTPTSPRKGEQCLVFTDRGLADHSCADSLPYVCYRKQCAGDRKGACGTVDKAYKQASTGSYKQANTGCYKLHTDPTTWDTALQICSAEGGHLAVPNSAVEAAVLGDVAKGMGNRGHVAIGYRQWGQIDSWLTVQGKTLSAAGYDTFCPTCPDYKRHPTRNSRQACGGLLDDQLDDIWCDVAYPFICELGSTLSNGTGAVCGSLPFLTC